MTEKLKDRRKVVLGRLTVEKQGDTTPKQKSPAEALGLAPLKSLDDFDVKEQIGHGTSSTVFRIVHRPTGGLFALKKIRFSENDETIRLVVNEVHCLNILRHANTVRLYGALHVHGHIHIVMALVDGLSLSDHLRLTPQVPEDVLGRVIYFVLQGLLYLRRNRFLHRDLKPTNILISNTGEVKIADFGMARRLSASTEQVQSFLGTICYMAPERLNCSPYSFKSDVWSLGMIVYQCATGSFPFSGATLDFWHLKDCLTQDVAVTLPDGYSGELSGFISACLRVQAKNRSAVEDLATHAWVSKYASAEYQPALLQWITSNNEKKTREEESLRVSLADVGVVPGK